MRTKIEYKKWKTHLFSRWPLYLFIFISLIVVMGKTIRGKNKQEMIVNERTRNICRSFCNVFVKCLKEAGCKTTEQKEKEMLKKFSDTALLNGCYVGCMKHSDSVEACYNASSDDCEKIGKCLSGQSL